MSELSEPPGVVPESAASSGKMRLGWLSWSSFFFAMVQSVCTAFVALSSVRLLVGAVAFAGALGVLKFAGRLHADTIRIPMMSLALIGAALNLLALWQVRRLRGREASAWRKKPLSRGRRTSERAQLILALLTIVLLAAEEWAHWVLKGRG